MKYSSLYPHFFLRPRGRCWLFHLALLIFVSVPVALLSVSNFFFVIPTCRVFIFIFVLFLSIIVVVFFVGVLRPVRLLLPLYVPFLLLPTFLTQLLFRFVSRLERRSFLLCLLDYKSERYNGSKIATQQCEQTHRIRDI